MKLVAMLVLGPVIIVPLVLACLALAPAMRRHSLSLLPFAPLPGLLAALFAPTGTTLGAPGVLLGASLAIDGHGRILLGFVALLWIAAGIFARHSMRDAGRPARFAAFWCLTLAGNLGVFIAGDVASFYAAFACVSLAAYPLVVHDRSGAAMRAGRVYIVLAIIGETCLLLGFMLGAAGAESLLIADVRDAIAVSPLRDAALLLLVAGFGIKAGLVPLHVWLPLAHPAAPTPASAVLSGAIVKAGIFGLMQFLPFGIALPGWHDALLAGGLLTAFFGIAVGLAQANPKTLLAYSTISQMGIVVVVLASALREGAPQAALAGATLYALHHGLAKGALFMGVGAMAASGARMLAPMLAVLALPALSIAGFPLTGGALAKLAIKPALGGGMAELLVTLSAVGTSLLLSRFLWVVASKTDPDSRARPQAGILLPWLFTTAAALLAPWALFASHSGEGIAYALAPGNLWSALWPLIVAGLVALVAWRARLRAPRIPEGDLLAVVGLPQRRLPSICAPGRWRGAFANARDGLLELATIWPARVEHLLLRWSVSGTLVLVLVLLLASCRGGS